MFYKKIFFLAFIISFLAITVQAQSVDEFHLDQVYSLDSEGTITLKSDDAKVTIIGSGRSNIHVAIDYKLEVEGSSFGDNEKFEMDVRQEGGNLFIRELPRDLSGVFRGNRDETYTILIEAPVTASFKLEGDDEQYKIENISGEIEVDADDADVNLKSYQGDNLDVRLDDGTLNIDSGQGALELNVDDGEAFIENGNFKKISLSSDDGNFEIHNQPPSNGEYKFNLDDSHLELDFSGEQSRSESIYVDVGMDDSKVVIHAYLLSGDDYQFDMNDAELKFHAVSGGGTFYIRHDDADISVDNGFEILGNEEGESRYQLGTGKAEIRIDADDGEIELRH